MATLPQIPDPAPLTDAELAQAAAGGDEAAFRQLYRLFVKRIRSLIFRVAGERALDDLTQEVFLRAFPRFGTLRANDAVGPWLLRIAANVAVDHLRHDARRPTSELRHEITSSGDAAKALEQRELVAMALATLDPEHRLVLVMRDLEQMPDSEVAEILEIPRGTVKSRLFHARQKVREFLATLGVTGVSP